jgi:metal-responsive CopG/Arc/MetJ family transcriptional regulator
MPSQYQNVTVSLPKSFVRALDNIRRAEFRGRSDMFRQVVREFLQKRGWRFAESEVLTAKGEVVVDAAALRRLDRAHAEIRRGEYVPLEDLLSEPAHRARRRRKKR